MRTISCPFCISFSLSRQSCRPYVSMLSVGVALLNIILQSALSHFLIVVDKEAFSCSTACALRCDTYLHTNLLDSNWLSSMYPHVGHGICKQYNFHVAFFKAILSSLSLTD